MRLESSEVRLSFLEHRINTKEVVVKELQSVASNKQAVGVPPLNPEFGSAMSTPGFAFNQPPQGFYSDWSP